jgi:hypothetical protein
MKHRYFFGSLSRISDLAECSFSLTPLPRTAWAGGDYVVGEITTTPGCMRLLELENGRMAELADGDLVVGAFGERAATLEAVGDWRAIGADQRFDMLTSAGLFGKLTSKSLFLPALMGLSYRGHVMVNGNKARMSDYVPAAPLQDCSLPVVLLVGTSMSAGKTTAARIIVRLLKNAGYRVIGAKLTGAGRYRDVLSMGDAGADRIYDFVDAGLPSTVCPEAEFRHALRRLMGMMADDGAEVLVAEAGASPLEPYNGSVAIAELERQVRFTVLCASDPYAVVGVAAAFERRPDLVAGGAANTQAGIQLVEKLTGIKALNLLDKATLPELKGLLKQHFGKL